MTFGKTVKAGLVAGGSGAGMMTIAETACISAPNGMFPYTLWGTKPIYPC